MGELRDRQLGLFSDSLEILDKDNDSQNMKIPSSQISLLLPKKPLNCGNNVDSYSVNVFFSGVGTGY